MERDLIEERGMLKRVWGKLKSEAKEIFSRNKLLLGIFFVLLIFVIFI